MKKEFFSCPETIDESKLYGFSWIESVLAVPTPLVCVTSYKENGLANATMQSWCTFGGNCGGFHIIFSDVNKNSHMYSSIKKTGQLAVNFPSADIYLKCYDTIAKNSYDSDEIAASGLTLEPASRINAPMIKECFLNIECEFEWEHRISENSDSYVFCVKAVGIHMDNERYNEDSLGRYGKTGYLYNIHHPINPDTGKSLETEVGMIQRLGVRNRLQSTMNS